MKWYEDYACVSSNCHTVHISIPKEIISDENQILWNENENLRYNHKELNKSAVFGGF